MRDQGHTRISKKNEFHGSRTAEAMEEHFIVWQLAEKANIKPASLGR